MTKTYHVVPAKQGGWDVKGGGAERAYRHVDIKQEAVAIAREVSRNQKAELLIHNKTGLIGQKDSHGHDPKRIKG